MNKIAITGAAGQLGSELCRRLGDRAIPFDLPEVDITSDAFLDQLRRLRPAAVINSAAYTNVDRAEEELEKCLKINAHAVERMAKVCSEIDSNLVQISTDYVFGGDGSRTTPWLETDPPCPQGVYARSKVESERLAATCRRHIIVRTCGLYAVAREGQSFRNFVQTMLRLAERGGPLRVVRDQHCTPSYVPHLAEAMLFLLDGEHYGTFHVVNRGQTTWYDFAVEIFRQAGVKIDVEPIATAEFAAIAARPAYSVLDTAKYTALGGPPLPTWQAGVAAYLQAARDLLSTASAPPAEPARGRRPELLAEQEPEIRFQSRLG